MKTLGYGRVSTQRQADVGTSKDTQHDDFLRFVNYKHTPSWELCAKTKDHEGTWFFDGAVSSTIWFMERPAGAALCAALEQGDHIVIPIFDRAFRSAADVENAFTFFDSKGVQVHILDMGIDTSGPMGRCMIAIMGAVKRLERQTITERTMRGKAKAKAEGMICGGRPPPGWKWSENKIGRWKKIVPCPLYRQYAMEVKRLVDEEGMTFDKIVILYWKEGRVRKDQSFFNKARTGWTQTVIQKMYHAATKGFPNTMEATRLAQLELAAEREPTNNLGR